MLTDASNNLKIYLDGDESEGACPLHFVQQVISPDVLPPPLSTVYTFVAAKRIHDGEESQVFRGIFTSSRPDGTSKVERLDTVCKLVSGDRRVDKLKKEAKLYATKLAKLQDNTVPIFYGFFRESTLQAEHPSKAARMCIVLQYCGECLTADQYESEEVRMRIARSMVALHDAGVEHGDFQFRHVLQMPGALHELRIIDFDHATEHRCTRRMEIKPGTWQPPAGHFNCFELFHVARSLGLYIPTFTSYCGRTISLYDYHTKSVEEWVAWGRKHAFEMVDIGDNVLREEADDILREFHMLYPNLPLDNRSPKDAEQAGTGGNST